MADQRIERELLLLSALHILEGKGTCSTLFFTHQYDEGDLETISIAHLLLHLHGLWIDLSADPFSAYACYDRQQLGSILFAEVCKEDLGTDLSFTWEESQLQEDVIDTVGAEGDTHTTEAIKPEDTGEVIIASAT